MSLSLVSSRVVLELVAMNGYGTFRTCRTIRRMSFIGVKQICRGHHGHPFLSVATITSDLLLIAAAGDITADQVRRVRRCFRGKWPGGLQHKSISQEYAGADARQRALMQHNYSDTRLT